MSYQNFAKPKDLEEVEWNSRNPDTRNPEIIGTVHQNGTRGEGSTFPWLVGEKSQRRIIVRTRKTWVHETIVVVDRGEDLDHWFILNVRAVRIREMWDHNLITAVGWRVVGDRWFGAPKYQNFGYRHFGSWGCERNYS
jgi:hypothetical protein